MTLSRRQLLKTSAAAAAGLVAPWWLTRSFGADNADEPRLIGDGAVGPDIHRGATPGPVPPGPFAPTWDDNGISVNLYVVHGGTSFGFGNGAYFEGHYRPDPTSYDYNAPIDEAGRVTPKYHRFREILARRLPPGAMLPPVPDSPPTMALAPVALTQYADFRDLCGPGIASPRQLTMEDIGQSTGFILYRTTLPAGAGGPLVVDGLRDPGPKSSHTSPRLHARDTGTLSRKLWAAQPRRPAKQPQRHPGACHFGRPCPDRLADLPAPPGLARRPALLG